MNIGLIRYTKFRSAGLFYLADRVQEVLPEIKTVSADDTSHPFYVKNLPSIIDSFDALLLLETYFNAELIFEFSKLKRPIILIPMWEYLPNLGEMKNYISHVFCLNQKSFDATKTWTVPRHKGFYPLKEQESLGKKTANTFFIIAGNNGQGRRRIDLLNTANKDRKFNINLFITRPPPFPVPNLNLICKTFPTPQDIYRVAGDVHIFLSNLEGLGMPVYESIERNLPTFCSNSPPYDQEILPFFLVDHTVDSVRKLLEKYNGKSIAHLKTWCQSFVKERSFSLFRKSFLSFIET